MGGASLKNWQFFLVSSIDEAYWGSKDWGILLKEQLGLQPHGPGKSVKTAKIWDHVVPVQNTKPFESRKYTPKYTSEPKRQTKLRNKYENGPTLAGKRKPFKQVEEMLIFLSLGLKFGKEKLLTITHKMITEPNFIIFESFSVIPAL